MTRARFRTGLLLMLLAWRLLSPAQEQISSDTQKCQGSTVDLQGEETAEKSRAFLVRLQSAVSREDKAEVASMISYPLLVIHSDSKTRIKNRSQLLHRYDSIFDAHVRAVIAQQSAKCLFGNYQGTMIGDGEVWYREQPNGKMQIVTVNSSVAKSVR